MSKGLKIFLGVVVALVIAVGAIFVIGGEDLQGRLRFRTARQSVQKIVIPKIAESVTYKCPEVPQLVYASTLPLPEGADSVEVATFGEFFELIYEEMVQNDYYTRCPYLIEYNDPDSGLLTAMDGKVKCAVGQMKFGANELGCSQTVGVFASDSYFSSNVRLSSQAFGVRTSYIGELGEFEFNVHGAEFNVWRVSE